MPFLKFRDARSSRRLLGCKCWVWEFLGPFIWGDLWGLGLVEAQSPHAPELLAAEELVHLEELLAGLRFPVVTSATRPPPSPPPPPPPKKKKKTKHMNKSKRVRDSGLA